MIGLIIIGVVLWLLIGWFTSVWACGWFNKRNHTSEKPTEFFYLEKVPFGVINFIGFLIFRLKEGKP